MNRIQRLLHLHKLYAPAGEHGSDAGGGDDVAVLDVLPDADGAGTAGAGEDTQAAGEGGKGGGEDENVLITIGDDPLPEEHEDQARAPEWVRDLRKQNREKDRVIRELQAQARLAAPAAQAVTLGAKPTLAACDFDEAKFETDLEAWHESKRKIDDQQRQREANEQKSREAWQAKLNDYGKAKTTLKVADFDDAEANVKDVMSITQQGVILNGSDNAAVLIYALGKNPKKAKELAAIEDPVKFAFAVAKLETQLKVTPRKTAPIPERMVRGSAPISGTVDNQLARLRADAEKTGDYTKVTQYKQQHRAKTK